MKSYFHKPTGDTFSSTYKRYYTLGAVLALILIVLLVAPRFSGSALSVRIAH